MNFKDNIQKIEKIIGYTFKDKSLLLQAFTRESFCNEKNRRKKEYTSNEVLEFFGDAVLSAAIVSIFLSNKTKRYEHGISTELLEGDFSNVRSHLSDKKNLSGAIARLGLQKYLVMGEGDSKLGVQDEPSVMEDLFESIIGAIYIDSDMDIKCVIGVVSKLLSPEEYLKDKSCTVQSNKNLLQEFCADKKRRLPAPTYRILSESGPEHKRKFICGCFVGDELVGQGEGKNRKLAESEAARCALDELMRRSERANVPTDALSEIKAYAQKNKLPSPTFKDLGESERSTDYRPEFIIECKLCDIARQGLGQSKQDARAYAARAVLDALLPKKEKPKAAEKPKKKSPVQGKRKFSPKQNKKAR
jgi:ribonuclease-3